MEHFSGSYNPSDVQFLLKRLTNVTTLGVAQKEALIQQGVHYSEVLSPESAPSEQYLALFKVQLTENKTRLATDVLRLAQHISTKVNRKESIAIVSLARAGTPVGVLLKRALESDKFDLYTRHYSVSIIRDRGLDLNALAYIRDRHVDENVIFVDGWTGKGVIGEELRASVANFNRHHGASINADLHVLADIAGTAAVCATQDDYLLPSAILNAPVSGLISRTVLNGDIGPTDFHGCAYLEHLTAHDQSRYFIDTVMAEINAMDIPVEPVTQRVTRDSNTALHIMVARLMEEHQLSHRNFVKPGVGEATRVMLRRVPKVLVVRTLNDDAVAHLIHLATEKSVPVVIDSELPCRAVALIEQMD